MHRLRGDLTGHIMMRAMEYIHRNPVRQGCVERTEDWMPSGAAWYHSGTGPLSIGGFEAQPRAFGAKNEPRSMVVGGWFSRHGACKPRNPFITGRRHDWQQRDQAAIK